MAFTSDELVNITNSTLEHYLDKGKVLAQNIANKPMLQWFNNRAGKFPGGKDYVSFTVKSGQGGGSLAGYSGDDQVSYYNPTGTKRARFPWKEHHIGTVITHTELKIDGIDVIETGEETTRGMDGREEQALANLLEEKMDALSEDYAKSLDELLHGDGTADTKALAGLQSIILASPGVGSTGNVSRVANSWWRNRAATAAYAADGGQNAITSATANGGALIEFLEKEWLQLAKYASGGWTPKIFAGSDIIAAYKKELRANGQYSNLGFQGTGKSDGGMDDISFKGVPIMYDPTLDALSLQKRMYVLDLGNRGIRLLYMDGQRMKKHKPDRPYDRYVMYQGLTMTGVVIAKQLNTSAVYDIA